MHQSAQGNETSRRFKVAGPSSDNFADVADGKNSTARSGHAFDHRMLTKSASTGHTQSRPERKHRHLAGAPLHGGVRQDRGSKQQQCQSPSSRTQRIPISICHLQRSSVKSEGSLFTLCPFCEAEWKSRGERAGTIMPASMVERSARENIYILREYRCP